MAREAGAHRSHNPELYDIWNISDKSLERFAALVIANHPPQSAMAFQEGLEAGRLTERERLQAFMRQMFDAYAMSSSTRGLTTGETE
jgi:hypothetical protein